MSIQKGLLLLVILISCKLTLSAQPGISDYKVCIGEGRFKSKDFLVIRAFKNDGLPFYVGVDPDNLETELISAKQISVKATTWQQIDLTHSNAAYVKALQTARSQSFSLQNSGIIHGFPKEKGVSLTIDLCPSHKPLDRSVLTSVIAEFSNAEKPVPIALSITGKFMLTHSADLLWLKGLIDSNEIKVTWINHTYNHRYEPQLPLKDNFLLEPNTDLNFEILETEKALLERGFLFSVFFRFPGLVSDNAIVDKVVDYGLIPIGSDAWLAKGQSIRGGSIVLIHGNGNEPIGIEDFIHLLRTEKASVLKKEWLLYDLRESIENEFKK